MRRGDGSPSDSTCCCLSSPKTLPIPAKDHHSVRLVNVPARYFIWPVFFSYGFTGLGKALLGEGRPLEAVEPLENAYAIRVE